jgi:hypothetical protein
LLAWPGRVRRAIWVHAIATLAGVRKRDGATFASWLTTPGS